MAMYTALVCLTKTSLQRFQLNDRAVVGHIYSIKSEDVAMVRSSELLAKLELEDLDLIVGGGGGLRWFGHVKHSAPSSPLVQMWIKTHIFLVCMKDP